MISFLPIIPGQQPLQSEVARIMPFRNALIRRLFAFAILALLSWHAHAQQKQGQSEDIVRVETALVQTDVMVFDKQGKFVDGLGRDQFVLKIEGKRREISFFEKVRAGSRSEEAQLAAARGNPNIGVTAPIPLDRGRTVFFFIDDLHISTESMNQVRSLLTRFVDREMGQNDQAAFISATGQIGFLQQLTDNKKVLLTAVDRLQARPYTARDFQRPPMSEYQALHVDQNDDDLVNFYVEYLLRENPMLGRAIAEQEVHGRASSILQITAAATTNTLSALKKLIESSRILPGRKLLFFISDGFLLDSRNSDAYDRLRQIISASAASAFVIYSIDARGLATGTEDASSAGAFDPSGRLSRGSAGELTATQDGLNSLAKDTGGRAFFNSNLLSAAVTTGLKESSVYYLLAWRPENDEQRTSKFRRIEVSVTGRPELMVRFRRGFGDLPFSDSVNQAKSNTAPEGPKPDQEVRAALRSTYPKAGLPISLSLNFMNLPQRGDLLVTSLGIATTSVIFEAQAGVPTANVILAGIVLDDRGKIVDTFDKRVTLRAKTGADTRQSPNLYYNNYSPLKPGLYQVRVAALDEKHGPAASAWQWIEIPNLSSRALALSSIIVGERKAERDAQQTNPDSNGPEKTDSPFSQVNLNIDHRFARSSYLRLLVFIYNASSTSLPAPSAASNPGPAAPENKVNAGPDVAVQVQVFRDDEPVITDALHKINTDGAEDPQRLPYAAELSLATLQPGRYVLRLTIIDRIAKATASQRFNFEVD